MMRVTRVAQLYCGQGGFNAVVRRFTAAAAPPPNSSGTGDGGRRGGPTAEDLERQLLARTDVVLDAVLPQPEEWPDPVLGCLEKAPTDFPLPGGVNIGSSTLRVTLDQNNSSSKQNYRLPECPEARRAGIAQSAAEELGPCLTLPLECLAHECPGTLKKEFMRFFRYFQEQESNQEQQLQQELTLLTLCQRTRGDMSSWSMEVEDERERLLEVFMEAASQICAALRSAGAWADFIDPSSGKPFLGSATNETFFETDGRLSQVGFEIEDLGCCKVVRHHQWGTHAFVGCIFTDAPLSHPVIKRVQLLEKQTDKL